MDLEFLKEKAKVLLLKTGKTEERLYTAIHFYWSINLRMTCG